jgi:hypothetical protein
MISLSVHSTMNRSTQFKRMERAQGMGFPMRSRYVSAIVVAAIIFPVLVVLFLTVSGGSIAVCP